MELAAYAARVKRGDDIAKVLVIPAQPKGPVVEYDRAALLKM